MDIAERLWEKRSVTEALTVIQSITFFFIFEEKSIL